MTATICPQCKAVDIDECNLCDECMETFASACDHDEVLICERCETLEEDEAYA